MMKAQREFSLRDSLLLINFDFGNNFKKQGSHLSMQIRLNYALAKNES